MKKDKYELNEKRAQKALKKAIKKIHKKYKADSTKNLSDWFDTIVADRWWDFHFLLLIIDKKLELMEKEWHNSNSKNWKKTRQEIRDAKSLLTSIINNDFTKKEEKAHMKKWGKILMDIEDDNSDKQVFRKVKFIYPKAKNKKEQKQAEKESEKVHELHDKRKSKAEDKFFKLFRKHYENWWD